MQGRPDGWAFIFLCDRIVLLRLGNMRFSLQTFFIGLLIFFVLMGGVFVFVAVQVFEHNLISISAEEIADETIRQAIISVAIQQGFIVLAMLAIIGGTLFFVLNAFVLSPVRKLHSSMQKVAKENFEVRLPKGPANEIGDLFDAFNDMTRRLKEAKEREELVSRMKSEFLSIAAHQLRTPLSAMKWMLSLALEGDVGKLTEQQKTLFQRGYQMNERLIHLVSDLLDVTRIEEGRFGFRPEEVSLEDLVGRTVHSFISFAKERNIDLSFESPSISLPKVQADLDRIGIVLQNLVENAIQYTLPGGKVKVSIIEQGRQFLQVSVSDTGVGIPAEHLPFLYDKFSRGRNVVHMYTEGTGLGLYITKNIIEAHHGKIWVESKEGEGSIFFFTLPIIKQK